MRIRLFITIIFCASLRMGFSQVATSYQFIDTLLSYNPLIAVPGTTPAAIFDTGWDDKNTMVLTLPFPFFYNGTTYPTGTIVGLDTDGWITFAPAFMTGVGVGGSWVSAVNSSGAYLYGSGNNNGFAGFDIDIKFQKYAPVIGNLTNASRYVTGITGTEWDSLKIGTRLVGNGIPNGTVIRSISVATNTFEMSTAATATIANASIIPCTGLYSGVRGSAPNREFVIQWVSAKKYKYATFPDSEEDINFQMILTESNGDISQQSLIVSYGRMYTSSTLNNVFAQVGLRGANNTDFNARKSTASTVPPDNWDITVPATGNHDGVHYKRNLIPQVGLQFIWKPKCITLASPSVINGPSPACRGTSQVYSIDSIPGASFYQWSYSGTNVTYSAVTTTYSNILTFAVNATGGILTVRPGNACGLGIIRTKTITVPALIPPSIGYPGTSIYCKSDVPKNPVIMSPGGGTFSSFPPGLNINFTTGRVTPATSLEGVYSVVYAVATGGCEAQDTTTVTIKDIVYARAYGTPASSCNAANVQLNAFTNAVYDVMQTTYALNSPVASPPAVNVWSTQTDDALSGPITIPFAFTFYGQSYSQFYISSNGYIQFGATPFSSNTPQLIPDASAANNIIALAWANLVVDPFTNSVSRVRYFELGTSPNRRMVIEFNNLRFLGGDGSQNVTGQIKLFEFDRHIEIHIKSINDNGLGVLKTMGIENSNGSVANAVPNRNIGTWNEFTPVAWSFVPSTVTYAWSPSFNLNSPVIANPVVSGLSASTNYAVLITDVSTGCTGTASVPVSVLTAASPTTTGNSRCGPGTVVLTANGGALPVTWYDAAVNGNVLGMGGSFTTPAIPVTTNFYATTENLVTGKVELGNGSLIATSYEGVFHHARGGVQLQYLIRASELRTAGLRAGSISNVAIKIPILDTQVYNGFTIAIASTALSNMDSGLYKGIFTTIYNPVNYTPAQGLNTFTFSVPYNWNGNSNFILKICWSNNNAGGIGNYAVADPTDYASGAYRFTDSVLTAVVCADTLTSGLLFKRPQFTFGGRIIGCRSNAAAVQALINPRPDTFSIDPPDSIYVCGTPRELKIIGGKYVTGAKQVLLSENFETFPSPLFAISGGSVSATSSNYAIPGSTRSVRVGYLGNSPTQLTSTTNSYQLSSNLNLSAYGSAQLSFSHICALEDSNAAFDAGFIQYSSDGGTTWQTLPATGYKGEGKLMNFVNGFPANGVVFSTKSYSDWKNQFTSVVSTPGIGPIVPLWKNELIDIPFNALTNQFRLRFIITCDVSNAYYGWLIDDLKITGYNATQAPTVWSPTTGLFNDAAGTINYTGTNSTSVYTLPLVNTSYIATGTGPTGCTIKDTVVVQPKPFNSWLGFNIDWNDPINWCPALPTSISDIVIPNGVTYYPYIYDSLPVARNIIIESNAFITIDTLARLRVYGSLQNSGTLNNRGNLTLCSIGMTQTYPGPASTIPFMDILEIATTGTGKVLLDKNTYVNTELKPTSGHMDLGNFNFTISSTDTLTARVSKLASATSGFDYSGTGRFFVERYIKQGRKWRLLAAPVTPELSVNHSWQEGATSQAQNPVPGYGIQINGHLSPLSPYFDAFSPGGPSVKVWNTITQSYRGIDSTTIPVANDSGYMVFVRGDRLSLSSNALVSNTTLRTKGKLITGNKTLNFTGMLAGQFICAANPYASAIELRSITRTNVSPMFYVWDPFLSNPVNGGQYGLGAFQLLTFNSGTGDYEIFPGTGSYGAANSVCNNLESGSAFFVKAENNGNSTLLFTENGKAAGSNAVFRMGGNNMQRFMMLLEKKHTDSSYFTLDGSMLHFGELYSNNVDAEDANKLRNTGENISIAKGNIELMLERHALVNSEDTIFLNIRNMKVAKYRIKFITEDLQLYGLSAYLIDNFLNTSTLLSTQGEDLYDFSITNNESAAVNRFMIVFKQQIALPVTFINVDAVRTNEKTVLVHWDVANQQNIVRYEVLRSLYGENFTEKGMINNIQNSQVNYLRFQRADNNAPAQTLYYRIKAIETSGRTILSNIVKLAEVKQKSSIAVIPNPVTGKLLKVYFKNQPKGNYSLKLLASNGQEVIAGKIFTITSNNEVHKIKLPANTAFGAYKLIVNHPHQGTITLDLIVE